MSQLIKHYWINRETGEWATDTRFGLMMPRIEGLEIQQQLFTQNDIPYFLSYVPDGVQLVETEGEGLKIITQQQWDDEIVAFDTIQLNKRLEILRKYRDILLSQSDWAVIKAKETGGYLSSDFKNWRQSLRDLSSTTPFPGELPTVPQNNEGVVIDQQLYNNYYSEVRNISMINDPLNS
jgi:hypothetical protein